MHEDSTTYTTRMAQVSAQLAAHGYGAALITPGPDLLYLAGYDAVPLERLTCLVLRPDAEPVLVVPLLEAPAASVSPYGASGASVVTWNEISDPYLLVSNVVGRSDVVAVDDHMWASKVLALRSAMRPAEQVLAGSIISPMRMRKSESEIAALREAGEAIDRVHALVPTFLQPGRTEREVGRDIAEAIVAQGHTRVDFIIVASGPNGASPHHEVSDRVLCPGDPVVVDIGGTMPSGYRSDCTRTYTLGDPGSDYLAAYSILLSAQQAGLDAVRAGVTCESIDDAPRDILDASGLGEFFIHRTGHGIGLETHEDPYLVQGNDLRLESGMSFSVEPGFYIPGKHGARIEDIVVCTDEGVSVLNHQPRDLVWVEA